MPLLGVIGVILVIVAVYLAAATAASLALWLSVLFVGVVLLAVSTGGDTYI